MPQNIRDCFYWLHGINCHLLAPDGALTSDNIKTTIAIGFIYALEFLVF